MAPRPVEDPYVVITLRIPKSYAIRWKVHGGDWRRTVRDWMIANAPLSFREEQATLEAARARGAAISPPEDDEF